MADQLSSRVFLAFDDTSRAGKHVLHFAKFDEAHAVQMPQNTVEKLLPADLTPYVQIFQYPDSQASIVTVNTAILPATQRWELSDALISALSDADVQELTILGALHLPYAKDDGLSVFYGGLNGTAAEDVDVAMLPVFGLDWELKDPWLATFLHFIKTEQWPRTHLLLAKGYKPGRDLTGTYEAVDKLSRALELLTKQKVTVDAQEVQRELPRLLTKEKSAATDDDDHLTLLYH
eukprot:jgi/Phyca11/119635/e_gw1.39.290.1